MSALAWHRLQFGFTMAFHYLFPQLTMGLALLLVIFKLLAVRAARTARAAGTPPDARYDELARFWARIFGINFAVGVATGVPMEFQFGTNWARFSTATGGVIGLTLALEGMFAFFAESAFLGLFLFGEKKLSRWAHLGAAVMLMLGSWSSGYFIIVTNAFMQHPEGHRVLADGRLELADVFAYMLNPWAIAEYAHVMCAAVVTSTFVVAAVAAYWMLSGQHARHAPLALRVAVIVGTAACLMQLFPTGDRQGKLVAEYQRPALAAMEGKFESGLHAELALVGEPNVPEHRLENPIMVPWALSFLAYGSFGATVTGLDDVPADQRPDNIELLYYAYHVMAGLGTLLIAVMGGSALLLWRGKLFEARPMLWVLMLAFPFPYIATLAGWMTTELGRQPWLVYGVFRTAAGTSPNVGTGDVVFTAVGFMGLYLLLGLLFVLLVAKEVARGPRSESGGGAGRSAPAGTPPTPVLTVEPAPASGPKILH
jgi:cytochrome d ubiquinol oxidase subunit I